MIISSPFHARPSPKALNRDYLHPLEKLIQSQEQYSGWFELAEDAYVSPGKGTFWMCWVMGDDLDDLSCKTVCQ